MVLNRLKGTTFCWKFAFQDDHICRQVTAAECRSPLFQHCRLGLHGYVYKRHLFLAYEYAVFFLLVFFDPFGKVQ